VFKGVVWAEFKLLVGVVLMISFGPGSCAGNVGAYAVTFTIYAFHQKETKE